MSEEIKKTSTEYSADSIQVLEGLEAVRKRPSMYIGDTSEKGLHHLVYEVVDNSIDEALAGYCSFIDVVINEDNSITVTDDGRGIPVDIHEKEGKSALEVVLTVLHAGGKFDKGTYKVSGGLHGVGVSCVNALSTYLRAEVRRDGKIHMQEFACGKPLHDVEVIGETDKTGTTISFKPDGSIFSVTEYKYDILATRLRELAFLNAGITLRLTDKRVVKEDGTFKSEIFHSEEGLKEFVRYIDRSKEKLIQDVIHIVTEKQGIPVEVAMTYNTSYNESVFSYVNDIHTIEGGTHLAGFRRGLTRTLKKYAEDSKLLEKAKVEIQGDDFREGLTAVISIKVAEPQFEGQTKTKLGNNEVTGAVDMAVGEALGYYLEEHPKEAKAIVDKVILAAQAFQAILPLRGKILNVEKAMEHKIFESEEIQNIYRAMGVTVGTADDPKELNIEKLRYHKIIIMTDADVDGSHIATLILTFFFRRMRTVIENGYVYLATPPLYKCSKGKVEEYCWTDQQRQQFILKYGGGNESQIRTQRYKGLGEMNDHQLWETTMDPEHRTLKQITIDNAAEADRIFAMLMGEDVGPRREFIEENATYANIDA